MERRRIIGGLLVLTLGGSLLGAFRGLSGRLPQLFPHLGNESRPDLSPPLTIADDPFVVAPEPAPPAAAAPVKLSGEDTQAATNDLSDQERVTRTSQKLVRSTPIPEVGSVRSVSESFEITPELQPIVGFWRNVYGVWNSNQVVFHDMNDVGLQYSLLDFSDLSRRDISDAEKKDIRDAEIRQETNRIKDALTELEHWDGGAPLSRAARDIAGLFRHVGGPNKFKEAKENLRTQTGLKDRFTEAIRRSGRYLDIFERVFQSYGVPREISRLAFVESMFKEKAVSKVGAVGLWQFMPDTARRYMTVDRLVDERYDPVMAAHGAARLLLRNHELLGTWPLAINAYNSGPGNLFKAISTLGTKEIGTIITRFRGGSYAFASRNFYPSFLAALEVYERADHYLGRIRRDPPFQYDMVELPTTMGFNEIAYLTDATLDDLKELNPSFLEPVFNENFALPAGSQIRTPRGGRQVFASHFIQYSSGMESPLFHVISPGESLHDIAGQYGLTQDDLQRTNPLERAETGRVLMIPSAASLVKSN